MEHKRLSMNQVLGALISTAGVTLIVLRGSNEGTASLIGDLFILGAAAVWVVYIFVSKKLRASYSSLAMNAWQSVFAVASLIPLFFTDPCDWSAIAWQGWLAMLVLGVVCSGLCYVLYGSALYTMSPLASSIFINLIPLTTIVAGVCLLGETADWSILVGGALIIGSIFIVNLSEGKA